MKKSMAIILLGIAILVVCGLGALIVGGGTLISLSNTENDLRIGVEKQQDKVGLVFDQQWKTVSQLAQVSDNYKDGFKEIYVGIMDGRYGKGDGTLMKWIQEANPTFDVRLYEKVANAIEASRAQFTLEQSKLVDMAGEHKKLVTSFPGNIVLGMILGRKPIEIKLITSTRTRNALETGVDDDVSLKGDGTTVAKPKTVPDTSKK